MPLNRGQIFQMAVGPVNKYTIARITGMGISITLNPPPRVPRNEYPPPFAEGGYS